MKWIVRPKICAHNFTDDHGAASRCWKRVGHEDAHGYGAIAGQMRWFLHHAPDDDAMRRSATAIYLIMRTVAAIELREADRTRWRWRLR